MKKRKEHCPHILLDITIKNLMPEAVKLGRELAVKYTQSRLCHSLLEATALRLEQELYANISGIPILGRIDAIVNDIPLDWKTRGFASKNPQYPTKGYSQKFIWEERDGRAYWRDQICPVETPIEKVNEGWAAQFLFYNWLLDNEPRIYVVHEVVNTNDGVVLIEHTNTISEEFEAKVMKEVRAMWEAITEKMYYAEVERPIPTKMMCEKYASLCEQAVYCKYYLETLGHTERREMLV